MSSTHTLSVKEVPSLYRSILLNLLIKIPSVDRTLRQKSQNHNFPRYRIDRIFREREREIQRKRERELEKRERAREREREREKDRERETETRLDYRID